MTQEFSRKYIRLRRQNAAWALLAARRAPLVLTCLKSLFEENQGQIPFEDAVHRLGGIFAENANADEFDLPDADFTQAGRRELRDWVKRGLVVEREGRLQATDALSKAFLFIDSLEEQSMTSTASRLATVQREIEGLQAKLNPAREARAEHLRQRIAALEAELEQVERGEFEVLSGRRAEEGIREVYQLAVSLRSDFRRVEDSFREADRQLRQAIIQSDQNRGTVLDSLLDGHEHLLTTPEGQVFDGFYEQLHREHELDQMTARLKAILDSPEAVTALNRRQTADLRWLVPGLLSESQRVLTARAQGESDVRGFIKTGLITEHHRVGSLLNDLLHAATEIDWSVMAVRRGPGPLPPVGISTGLLPLVQRLRFKEAAEVEETELDLTESTMPLDELGEDFWQAFDVLDRSALFRDTEALLQAGGRGLTLGELAEALPPAHDLETLTYWLSLGREAEIPFSEERETIDLRDKEEKLTRFDVPRISLNAAALASVDPEVLG